MEEFHVIYIYIYIYIYVYLNSVICNILFINQLIAKQISQRLSLSHVISLYSNRYTRCIQIYFINAVVSNEILTSSSSPPLRYITCTPIHID